MTMMRRPVGRGRLIAVVGALIVLAGCLLPWWQLGGGDGIPPISGNAFEAIGIVVFVVALATLALVTLPYALGDVASNVDRWFAYALLAGAGWIALGIRALDLFGQGALGLPDTSPGLWLSGAGLAVLSRAAYDVARERPGR